MNEVNIYSIYDAKANAYMEPWFLPTEPMAIRAFTDVARDEATPIGTHPEDYHLVQVGTWNPKKGTIVSGDAPLTIATATAVIHTLEVVENG